MKFRVHSPPQWVSTCGKGVWAPSLHPKKKAIPRPKKKSEYWSFCPIRTSEDSVFTPSCLLKEGRGAMQKARWDSHIRWTLMQWLPAVTPILSETPATNRQIQRVRMQRPLPNRQCEPSGTGPLQPLLYWILKFGTNASVLQQHATLFGLKERNATRPLHDCNRLPHLICIEIANFFLPFLPGERGIAGEKGCRDGQQGSDRV